MLEAEAEVLEPLRALLEGLVCEPSSGCEGPAMGTRGEEGGSDSICFGFLSRLERLVRLARFGLACSEDEEIKIGDSVAAGAGSDGCGVGRSGDEEIMIGDAAAAGFGFFAFGPLYSGE